MLKTPFKFNVIKYMMRLRQISTFDRAVDDTFSPMPPRPPSLHARRSAILTSQGRETLYGLHSCAAALSVGRRHVHAAHILATGERAPLWRSLLDARRIPVHEQTRREMESIAAGGVHQGIALDVDILDIPTMTEAISVRSFKNAPHGCPLIVFLAEVVDVGNVGAILRSALLLGADAVVTNVSHSAPLNAAVSRASAGALEYWARSGSGNTSSDTAVPPRLWNARNAAAFIEQSNVEGWLTLGASAPSDAVLGRSKPQLGDSEATQRAFPVNSFVRDRPTIIVLGNEHGGLSRAVERACSKLVYIAVHPHSAAWGSDHAKSLKGSGSERRRKAASDMPANFGGVESLNVSSAAALLLQQLRPPSGSSPTSETQ